MLVSSGVLLIYNNNSERKIKKESNEVVLELENDIQKNEENKENQNISNEFESGISFGAKYSKKINNKNYIGILYFPTISNLAVPVIDELSDLNLKSGSCRYYGNVENNLVIGGHNYKSIFGKIDKELKINDTVYFKQLSGEVIKYTLSEKQILKPNESEKLINSNYDMTIFTCTYDGSDRIAFRFENKTY